MEENVNGFLSMRGSTSRCEVLKLETDPVGRSWEGEFCPTNRNLPVARYRIPKWPPPPTRLLSTQVILVSTPATRKDKSNIINTVVPDIYIYRYHSDVFQTGNQGTRRCEVLKQKVPVEGARMMFVGMEFCPQLP